MTTIFAYPLKNAWVIASDKLESNQTESQRKSEDRETKPVEVVTKIKSGKRFVYGFSGPNLDIEKVEENLLSSTNKNLNYEKFCKKIKKLYGDKLFELDVEVLLIDSEEIKAYKIVINKIPNKLSKAKIKSIENGYIGSGALKSSAKYQSTSMLTNLRSITIKNTNPKELRSLLSKTVTAMEILAKSDAQFTGHPAVYGCNICIAMNNKILFYDILPKNYVCKEKKESRWFNLEGLEDA